MVYRENQQHLDYRARIKKIRQTEKDSKTKNYGSPIWVVFKTSETDGDSEISPSERVFIFVGIFIFGIAKNQARDAQIKEIPFCRFRLSVWRKSFWCVFARFIYFLRFFYKIYSRMSARFCQSPFDSVFGGVASRRWFYRQISPPRAVFFWGEGCRTGRKTAEI